MKRKSNALGSGFIIDSSGLILTNNHVVEKADEIKVRLKALSPAAEAGIRRGDVIKEINRKEVQKVEDMRSIIEDLSQEDTLLLVKHGKSTFYVVLEG